MNPLVRVAAALLAVSLSGAPRIAAELSPAECHVCRCRAHAPGAECPCALCRKAALEARATDRKSPPCHRAAARATLARSTRDPFERLVEGSCGATDHAPLTFAGVEPFLVSSARPLGALPCSGRVPASPGRLRELPRRPPTPPPRTA